MRTPLLLLNPAALLLFAGCATRQSPAPAHRDERPDAVAAKARYWAIQAIQKPAPVLSAFELLPLVRPERTEDGIIRTSSTDYVRVPRRP